MGRQPNPHPSTALDIDNFESRVNYRSAQDAIFKNKHDFLKSISKLTQTYIVVSGRFC
jgi:hypothetical protein